jgi:hypothetical protein
MKARVHSASVDSSEASLLCCEYLPVSDWDREGQCDICDI